MDYVQVTDAQRLAMLAAIGVERVDDLYASLPVEFRLPASQKWPGWPGGLSELELLRELELRGGANMPAAGGLGGYSGGCFLGAGAYDHFIPAVVDALAGRGEFVTAYTPYQAEASQGSLQAFFEFQTQICRLTGLDVANASLYEGASALAEAVLLCLRATGKQRVLAAGTLHPHYLQTLRTYLHDLPASLVVLPPREGAGVVALDTLTKALEDAPDDTACVVVASPNVYGCIEDWTALFAAAHQSLSGDGSAAGPLAVALFNPLACALFKRPGDCGADIAVGEGQPLGLPLSLGGPYLGLMAARQELLRRMPGRLVGQTLDAQGRRAFCLTLQTREQHIRGAKATSNVCTNQGLTALRATIYLSALGPQGLREVARHCYHKAHYAATLLAGLKGYALARPGSEPGLFFHEFVLDCPVSARRITAIGRRRRILPGLDCSALGIGHEKQLLVAVTEKRTRQEIDALGQLLQEAAS